MPTQEVSVHLPTTVISRHHTSEGVVLYSRCTCGALDVWLQGHDAVDSLIGTARPGRPVTEPSAQFRLAL